MAGFALSYFCIGVFTALLVAVFMALGDDWTEEDKVMSCIWAMVLWPFLWVFVIFMVCFFVCSIVSLILNVIVEEITRLFRA